MKYLETILFVDIVILLINAAVSDLKYGLVNNKAIVTALTIGTPLVVIYYAYFVREYLVYFAFNLMICSLIAIILYAMGIWGAGDSKLLLSIVILLPARIYCVGGRSFASCFLLISSIFIISFIFVVVETIVVGLRQKNLLKLPKIKFNWLIFARGFLFYFFLIGIVNLIFSIIVPDSVLSDNILMVTFQFITILVGIVLEKRATWIHVFVISIIWISLVIFHLVTFSLSSINIRSYLCAIVLIVFRIFADKYNYQTIPVEDLQPNMIVSLASTILFAGSNIQGLPALSTEDLKSRLTQDQVDSIKKWSLSDNGCETITIIRKIPFAIFIGVGTLCYIMMEVVLS